MVCESETCKNYWSCRYLQHRFKTKECNPNKFMLVENAYRKELEARESLLRGTSK